MNSQSTSSVATPAPKINRSDVLRLTWELIKKAKLSFAVALKKAWATLRLKAQMLLKPVGFCYRKEDGSERFAIGHYPSTGEPSNGAKPLSPLVVRYFDLLADGWRSFRIDRLIC